MTNFHSAAAGFAKTLTAAVPSVDFTRFSCSARAVPRRTRHKAHYSTLILYHNSPRLSRTFSIFTRNSPSASGTGNRGFLHDFVWFRGIRAGSRGTRRKAAFFAGNRWGCTILRVFGEFGQVRGELAEKPLFAGNSPKSRFLRETRRKAVFLREIEGFCSILRVFGEFGQVRGKSPRSRFFCGKSRFLLDFEDFCRKSRHFLDFHAKFSLGKRDGKVAGDADIHGVFGEGAV